MTENISTNEFMFFKNEVLSEFKKIEQKFTKVLEEQNQEIIKKYNISEQRVKLLQDKLFDFASEIEKNNKLTIELKPLLEMKNKYDETMLMLQTKIDSLDRDIQTSLYKYDSLFNNGFLVPGLIGPNCKFNSVKNFLEYSNKILMDYSTFKNKQTIDLKSYKEKLENIIQSFKLQNENMNNTFLNHCKKILKENKENFEERVKITEDKLEFLRIENNKHSNELIETTKKLNIEWDKLNIFKIEVNKRLENNELKVEQFHQDMLNKFEISKNDNLLIKQKFINLSEFIKDVRFRRNIGLTVRTKEFKDMSKNIDFTRKQKLRDDFRNETNVNDELYNELLLKLKDEFIINDYKKNDKNIKSNIKNENEKEIITKNYDINSVKSNLIQDRVKEIMIINNDNHSVKSNIINDNVKEIMIIDNDNDSDKSNSIKDDKNEIITKNNDNNSVKSNIKSNNEKEIITKNNDNNSVKSNIIKYNENEDEKEDEKEISLNLIKSEEIEKKIMLEEEKEVKSFKIDFDNKKEKMNKIPFPKSNDKNINNINYTIKRHNRTKTENIKNIKILLPDMNKKKFLLPEQFPEISIKEENNSRNITTLQFNNDSSKKQNTSYFKSFDNKKNKNRNNFLNGNNNMIDIIEKEKRHFSLFQIQQNNVNKINDDKINEINLKIIKFQKHIIDLENKTQKQFENILTQIKRLINKKKIDDSNDNKPKIHHNTSRSDFFCKTFSNININDNYTKPSKKRPKLYVNKKLSLKMSESERKTITSFHSKYSSNKLIDENNNKNLFKPMNNVTLINKIEPYLINKFKDK